MAAGLMVWHRERPRPDSCHSAEHLGKVMAFSEFNAWRSSHVGIHLYQQLLGPPNAASV